MQVRFLLGPAGSGKTFRCLAEIRDALQSSAEGPPLILLAPKQATFQLERQLLSDPGLPGYTRLRILSFERLAHFVFEQLRLSPPSMLDEEGRLMVLRALLAKKRDDMKLFRASARLAGFARQLSLVLREIQASQLTPDMLKQLAAQLRRANALSLKLEDLAALLETYLEWLANHRLQDADSLVGAAAMALNEPASETGPGSAEAAGTSGAWQLWMDGFSELSSQELDLLAAVALRCERLALAFCLDREPIGNSSWLSHWSLVQGTFNRCRTRLAQLADASATTELLPRGRPHGRFGRSPALAHLEANWEGPVEIVHSSARSAKEDGLQLNLALIPDPGHNIRLVTCADPDAEATLAAREILRFVREGGRFRQVSVLVRSLEGYHKILQRVFTRYEIPFFLDRRESVSHHPLAELTRSALRTVALQWQHEDWFAALKTGLVPADETEIDRLENAALEHGWRGAAWQQPIRIADDPELATRLESLRNRILPPFQRLALQLAAHRNRPSGPQLAAALRDFWRDLDVESQLERWSAGDGADAQTGVSGAVHQTVWDQLNSWLDNVELAFAGESPGLRDWLPILEAGLGNLTVGVIPPALDQVLIGAVDRSRNPEIRLALLLGMNETVFPALPEPAALLSESDREQLQEQNISLGTSTRRQLGRERYYGYIACTRASERILLACSSFDSLGKPLNPSPFLSQIRRVFPTLEMEAPPSTTDWRESEHISELLVPLARMQSLSSAAGPVAHVGREQLTAMPAMALALARVRQADSSPAEEALSPECVEKLYGRTLRTSVSRLEQFAECPFRFYVHSGLRAEERKVFELDAREQGSFQHDVLRLFHEQLRDEKKKWRDVTPAEARERIGQIARALNATYRDGLLKASDETRFIARTLTESLQDFVETAVDWMRSQYQFDPVAVEIPFGGSTENPAWELDLGDGRRLSLHGRIDRVDLSAGAKADEALCVVIDYKSSSKRLEPVLVENGIQLQLLAYLNALRRWRDPRAIFGVSRLIPAGVFYVNLRGRYEPDRNRDEALAEIGPDRKLAFRHTGRFDQRVLRRLDSREGAPRGDQFNYRLNRDGSVSRTSREAMGPAEFEALLVSAEETLRNIGRQIFSGAVQVAPYRKGAVTACDHCDYQSVCRVDTWTIRYRSLRKNNEPEAEPNS